MCNQYYQNESCQGESQKSLAQQISNIPRCYNVNVGAAGARAGVMNLFAIEGHFVSYCWASGPHNFL